MNFEEALKLLKAGKKIRRKGWKEDHDKRCFIFGDELCCESEGGVIGYVGLSIKNMLADDWEEYKEPLLTEEEKEYLRRIIKFSPGNIKLVTLDRYFGDCNYIYLWHSLDDRDNSNSHCVNKKFFKNLEGYRCYTLEELGLDEA